MNPHPHATDCPTNHCAGFDPDTLRADRYPGPPLDEAWQAALDGALSDSRHLRRDEDPCHVPECGTRRCSTCGERLMCTGPEPVAIACAAHDDECQDCAKDNPCRQCADERRRAAA